MLQTMRKYTQGWVATIMGIILSLAFVLWGVENYLSGNGNKSILAKVNGKEITSEEVNNDLQHMAGRLKDQLGSQLSVNQLQQQLKVQALNNIIMQRVLIDAAVKAGFIITPQEISAMIKQMPAFQEKGRFSRERFDLLIAKMGYRKQDFISDVSQTLLLNQVASGIIGSTFVLPGELNQAIALLEQQRDFSYAVLSSSDLKKNIHVTEAEIQSYYDQHKNEFKLPAKLQIEYVELTSQDVKKNIAVTQEEINDYLNSNNQGNSKNSKLAAKAKEAIQQQKLEQAFLAASDKLTDLAYTSPTSLRDAADALGLKVNTSAYFSQAGGETLLTKHPKVISAAFNAESIKNHTNSNVIELSPGALVVLRVKNYQPESAAPLQSVKEQIKNRILTDQANLKTKQKGDAFLAKIKTKQDFSTVLAAQQVAINAKHKVARTDNTLKPEIVRLAFATPIDSKPATGMQLSNGDYVLLTVTKSVTPALEKISDNQRAAIGRVYSNIYGKLDYNLYTENQIANSKIKIYPQRKH